jgi:hypothetical protein
MLAEAAGQRHAGQAGEVGDGVDVGQVHLHRVGALGAEGEGHRRRGRAHDHVALLEGFDKVGGDQAAHLLRLR